ncbi:MAG: phosphatase PAP2 family protein [Microbacteriaceae bacterium]|nr:MAG: phosphatase PAP2 family protein [Microbacteriaceae bacterium]
MSAKSPLRTAPFVWGALGSAAAFAGVYLFFVRSYMGQLVDERAFAGADAWQADFVAGTQRFLDVLPYLSVGAACVLGIAIVLVRHNWLVFVAALSAAAAANISTQLLKYLILGRPQRGVADGLANSLPSGHATVAASAALVVFLLAAPRYRPTAAVIGSIYTLVAGAATLVNQWHRPSDVVAALLVVAFWGCGAGFAMSMSPTRTAEVPTAARLVALAWVSVGCAVVAAIALAITYTSALAGVSHLLIAYLGGLSAIVAVAFALAAAGNRIFRWLA